MPNSKLRTSLAAVSLLALTIAAASAAPVSAPVDGRAPALRLAKDLGVSDAAKEINITVRLKLRDQDLFDKTLAALYEPGSPTFHKWLTDADLARFAPPSSQMEAVRAALVRNGLTILSTDRNGFSIRAHGTIAQASRAFNTELHEFEYNGHSFRANVAPARLSGAAGGYVQVVAGLESHQIRPMLSRAVNLATGKPRSGVPVRDVEASGGLSSMITDAILGPAKLFSYTTPGAKLPTAGYMGNVYDPDSNLVPDYTPAQLQSIYNLTADYKAGLDGTGQTVVLLEGYGYPAIESDANAFSKMTGLPALTSANFSIVYPQGQPQADLGYLVGWDIEIALDVDWSHSMAPGAKIVVVATKGQDSEDFQNSMQYIIDNHLGNSVSDSWEEDTDLISGPYEENSFEAVLAVAAAKGISFQFSTGDSGDGGLGTPIGAAGVPSVAPHATAVGGTAILNNVGKTGFESVGWGDTFVVLAADGPFDPPEEVAADFAGGGGGSSIFFPKPAWQKSLPGTFRQTPDVSALADPYTGVPIVITPEGGEQEVQVGWGGTSLASPIFSAIWAIANQRAGKALGQAAPTIAGLTSGVTDVLPVTSSGDVFGHVTDSSGTTKYSATALFDGFIPEKQGFTSAVFNIPEYAEGFAIGFALDSSLNVTKGWDNATGYGTPDGQPFIKAAATYK